MTLETYDSDNIFAKILAGDIPCHKVYEDAGTLVFMDILPASDGHCLVIPKAPSRNLLDAADGDMAACIATASKVSRAIMKALDADGVTLRQNNEEAGGQEVFHTHFHLMPRYEGQGLRVHDGSAADHPTLAATAAKIAAAIE